MVESRVSNQKGSAGGGFSETNGVWPLEVMTNKRDI